MPKTVFEKIVLPKLLVIVLVFISFFMPLYALSVGLINNFLKNTDIGLIIYFNSFFFFLLVLIIVNERIKLTKIFNYSSLLVVLITLGSYCVLVYNPKTFGSLYQYFVVNKGVAVYGLRNYGDFTLLMMFYKTSPLLIFPLSYYLYQVLIKQDWNKIFLKIIILIFVIITLFLSGTRANILSLFLIILFYISFYLYKKSKIIFAIVSIFYIFIALYGLSAIGGFLLSKQEVSNMIKFRHFISYIEHFSDNIGGLIFGQGIGGSFYSLGINRLTNITELSYFELVRIWGLPITIIFILVLIIPIFYEIKSRNISHLFIAYIAYLFIAGTNPLLLSSTGMIVLVYVFSNMFLRNKNYSKV